MTMPIIMPMMTVTTGPVLQRAEDDGIEDHAEQAMPASASRVGGGQRQSHWMPVVTDRKQPIATIWPVAKFTTPVASFTMMKAEPDQRVDRADRQAADDELDELLRHWTLALPRVGRGRPACGRPLSAGGQRR
jgi:hypothetical protein